MNDVHEHHLLLPKERARVSPVLRVTAWTVTSGCGWHLLTEAVRDVTVVRVGVGLEAWNLLCLQSCYSLRGEPAPPVHFTDAETEPCRRAVTCPGSLSKTHSRRSHPLPCFPSALCPPLCSVLQQQRWKAG